MAALPPRPELVTISTPGGARFTVAAAHKDQFQGLVNDLEAGGYLLDPKTSGGYNPRYIAGTTTPSEHAFGRAIDVNWNDNARGRPGTISSDVAHALAQKYGMTWGGDWKNRDDMHFEVRRDGSVAAVSDKYIPTGDPGFKSGLKFGVASTDPGPTDYGGGGDLPAAPAPDNSTQRALLLALSQQGGGLLGGGGLGDMLSQGAQPQQPQPAPIIPNQQQLLAGGPIPLSRRLG